MQTTGMKSIRNISLLISLGIWIISWPAVCHAVDEVEIYFFWGDGCPHCEREKAFLAELEQRYHQVKVSSFEVWYNKENAKLFSELAEAYGKKVEGVPVLFIGDYDPIVGYLTDEITGRVIEERVKACIESGCIDPVSRLKRPVGEKEKVAPKPAKTGPRAVLKEEIKPVPKADEREPERPQPENRSPGQETAVPPMPSVGGQAGAGQEGRMVIPFWGEIDTSGVSLPVLTLVIAGMDGFNPCAFFVLFILLSLLIYTHSKKMMLLVGGVFVFFSGFVYFLFMSAWLNFFLLFGHVRIITSIAAVVALIVAAMNIKDFFFFKKGVSLTIPERAKSRLYGRMRGLLGKGSLPSMVAGTIVLAVAANSYELLCTAGFPMVYTRVLTIHQLSMTGYYLYLVLYNVVYVIPLAGIVLLFSITLGKRKFTEGQGRVLKLISGLMMLSLGIVLLVSPGLLSNVLFSALLLISSLSVAAIIVFITRKVAKSGAPD